MMDGLMGAITEGLKGKKTEDGKAMFGYKEGITKEAQNLGSRAKLLKQAEYWVPFLILRFRSVTVLHFIFLDFIC